MCSVQCIIDQAQSRADMSDGIRSIVWSGHDGLRPQSSRNTTQLRPVQSRLWGGTLCHIHQTYAALNRWKWEAYRKGNPTTMYFAIGKVGFELLFKLSFFILHTPLTFHIHVYHNMNA